MSDKQALACRQAAKGGDNFDPSAFPLGFSTGGAARRAMSVPSQQQSAVALADKAPGMEVADPACCPGNAATPGCPVCAGSQCPRHSTASTGMPSQQAGAGAEAALDAAATVLRLLYLRDLRALQTQIDEALVRVQARAGSQAVRRKLSGPGRPCMQSTWLRAVPGRAVHKPARRAEAISAHEATGKILLGTRRAGVCGRPSPKSSSADTKLGAQEFTANPRTNAQLGRIGR